jgi:GT2 family glycosyltransferase/glycosyltransferase involved in cell wall biosynthesis
VSVICDIVIPVHNALHLTRALLESLARWTGPAHRIFLLDDASDPHVAAVLRTLADGHDHIRLERTERNRGFVKTANAGLALTTAPYVCLLNSDTLVTAGWLDRLIRCAESDPAIMVVNPISNAAANLSVAMPPGYTPHMMAQRLAEIAVPVYPDVVTAVGFCLFLKREALDRWGGFDEAYGMGYCEESDYCMRVMADGFRVVAAEDAFVYHRGESSFSDREARYAANRALFDSRWASLYAPRYAAFLWRNPLQYLRDRLFENLELAGPEDGRRPVTSSLYKLWRAARHVAQGRFRVVAVRAWQEVGAGVRRAGWTLRRCAPGRARHGTAAVAGARPSMATGIPEARPLGYPTPAYVRTLPRASDRLRIVFLVEDPRLSGGVIQICQLANRFVIEGHDAMVVTLSTEDCQRRLGLISPPLVYRGREHLFAEFPEADVVVATYWTTAWEWIPRLREGRRFVPVYFVQDFEPYFYPEYLPERRRALESYRRVDARVVTSGWLQGLLRGLGCDAVRIPVGVNLDVFYPRPARPRDDQFAVAAITRPDPAEARRGFAELVEACRLVHREDSSIRFEFFGCEPAAMPRRLGFPYRHHGVITDPERVARLLASCDLLVDPSRYQAFGRPGLEAMACGIPTVLPDQGGVVEYARDGDNTLTFRGGDAASMARAILTMRRDDALRQRVSREGLKTAQGFDHRVEARRHLALYQELVERAR